MHYRMLNSISGFYTHIISIHTFFHHDVIIKTVSRQGQLFSGEQNHSKLRSSVLEGWCLYCDHLNNQSHKGPDIYHRPSGAWIILVLSHHGTGSLKGSLNNMTLLAFTKLIQLLWSLQHYFDFAWHFWKMVKILGQKHKIVIILKIFLLLYPHNNDLLKYLSWLL